MRDKTANYLFATAFLLLALVAIILGIAFAQKNEWLAIWSLYGALIAQCVAVAALVVGTWGR